MEIKTMIEVENKIDCIDSLVFGLNRTADFLFQRHAGRHDAPRHSVHSVLAGNQQARTQTLGSILGPPLRLGYLRQFYVDLLIRDAVEQMPDQV